MTSVLLDENIWDEEMPYDYLEDEYDDCRTVERIPSGNKMRSEQDGDANKQRRQKSNRHQQRQLKQARQTPRHTHDNEDELED